MIWVSSERSFAAAELDSIVVKGDDVRSGRKANALHGRLRAALESMC